MLLAAPAAAAAGLAGALLLARGEFAIGWALLMASVAILHWPRSLWASAPARPRLRRPALALVAVCGLAVFFRFYRLNQPGLWGDDALNGLLAFDILDGRIRSPFEIIRHSHSYFHALSDYPIAGAFRLFGPDLWTLRLPGAVLGLLCVPLLYGTAAPLFGSATAIVAASFYATSAPQLIHAKELVQIITGQFFQLAGLCLLVQGLAKRRTAAVAASGVPLALCVYTYHSARIAPLVGIVYAAALLWSERSQPQARRRAGACGVTLASFALSLVPAALGWWRDPDTLVQRVGETSIWPVVAGRHSLGPLWDSAWRTLSIFHYQQGPEYYWFGIASDPALNVVVGFLLVHGLVESVRRWREPRHLLLLVWFAAGLAPAVFSTGAPRIYRAFLATPPLYVWAALPVATLLAAPAARATRMVQRGTAIVLLAAVPLIDFNYYFYRVYTHPAFRWFQGERIVAVARELRALGPGWTGYLLADTFDATHETLRFLTRAWHLNLESVGGLSDVLPLPAVPERGAAFLMSAGALGAAPAIERMYPGQPLALRREPEPRRWWFDDWWSLAPPPGESPISVGVYAVPRAAAEHPNEEPPWGLDLTYDVRGRALARHEPYPFYAFLAPPFMRSSAATWRGRLRIPNPGGYRLDVLASMPATTTIDGRRIMPDSTVSAGEHDFVLSIANVSDRFRLAIYWEPPDAPRALVPPSAFAP